MSAVDLHTHSTASDGSLSPAALVQLAARSGLAAIALTDHDTLAGLAEAEEAGRLVDLEVIRGCELAARIKDREIHILGLLLPAQTKNLSKSFDQLMLWRMERNMGILERLTALNKPINPDEFENFYGSSPLGRPHIAEIMLRKGYVANLREAFINYLGERGSAYVPKKTFSPAEIISVLKKDHGLTVLAHPYLLGLSFQELQRLLLELKDMGLDGLEAWHSEHPPYIAQSYVALAAKLGLSVSGGSDFHGLIKPDVALGRVKGGGQVSDKVLVALKKRVAEQFA